MNIIERTCATCCAFNPAPEGDDPACLNLTFITENHGTPQALTACPENQGVIKAREIETARAVMGNEALGRIFDSMRNKG